MAIAPTPNNSLFKGFVFDGVDSRNYGVYISGDAVFNAPERDVEMIEIPGRNGAFALDKGRFSNIEVTYPAGLFGNSEADFAAGINALRNALASRKGYCRLEDDYNSNEYRMAVYKSGLDVTPARLKAGQFDIVFECKPQRFLKSGETAQAVTSGGTITNPTLQASKPLLEVTGMGDLSVGDVSMTIGGTSSQTLFIDCDIMETYSVSGGTITPQNSLVTLSGYEYPALIPGETEINFTGISQVVVTPRWWCL